MFLELSWSILKCPSLRLFPEGIFKEKPLKRVLHWKLDCVQRHMSREWGEIYKPWPVVPQKFDQEEEPLFIGTVGCPEASEGSPEGDWHSKLDSPLGSGRPLFP